MARTATRKNRGKKTHRGKKTRRSVLRRRVPPKIHRVQAMANLSALLRQNNDELENFGNNGNANNANRNGRENPLRLANENVMNNLAESVRRM